MAEITRRSFFRADHEIFRDQVRRFIAAEVTPFHAQWERDGVVDRGVWKKAGAAGLLCPSLEEAYGGPGGDFLHSVVVIEELAKAGATGPGFVIHSEMVAPYLVAFGTPQQQRCWLPRFVSGDVVGAVAMTEPGAGSDLRSMRTRGRAAAGGWLLGGQKVFISNGQLADVVVVAAKTEAGGKDGLTLFLVDTASAGFRRGRNLDKIGAHAQDTSELFFDDVFVPDANVLGEVGQGFKQLMHGLVRERLTIAVSCQAKAEAVLRACIAYVQERSVFGQQLSDFQNTRFRFAEMQTETTVGRAYVDDLLCRYLNNDVNATEAAMGKLWATEMLGRTVDACLQLYGGWGYMAEYPIARAYVDARIDRIAGGSSEIMKEIIGRAITQQ